MMNDSPVILTSSEYKVLFKLSAAIDPIVLTDRASVRFKLYWIGRLNKLIKKMENYQHLRIYQTIVNLKYAIEDSNY